MLIDQERFDDALAVIQQAEIDDPRNDAFRDIDTFVTQSKAYGEREKDVKDKLNKNPYDVDVNLDLAQIYQAEGKFPQLDDTLRRTAALTNWTDTSMARVIEYYVDEVHNYNAAIAFVEARSHVDAKDPKLFFELAALHAIQSQNDDALLNLGKAITLDPTNVPTAATIDPRFAQLHDDPRFQNMVNNPPTNAATATLAPPAEPTKGKLKKPVKKT
jgi:tetratricopeptide (TPR) repeat protein